ncbi:MAG: aldose 1-epimerase family protein [Alphaproteobacteria bacterium]|nr:aldose 1-epimerase family protein [Alphaproteobacteria bacterium]
MTRPITIAAGAMTAAIHPLGAELHSFRPDGSREWLWQGEPAWWSGRSPLLFPVVGRSPDGHVRWQGRRMEMPPHGVARQSLFRVVEAGASAARFELVDDAMTRSHYPFAFRLVVDYALAPSSLTMTARVENPSREVVLPACLGFHPGFAWPLVPGHAKTAHVVRFEHDEPAPIRRIDRTGLGVREPLPSPVRGRVLALDDSLFVDDAIIFDRLASRRLWFGVPGAPGLRVEYPDCPHLGIWMKPGAPYLCLEPWQGFAPDIGDDGDLANRPGIVLIPPGGTLVRTLRLAPDDVPAA